MKVILILNNGEWEEIDGVREIDGLNYENKINDIPTMKKEIEIYCDSWNKKRALPKSLIKEIKITESRGVKISK